MYTVYAGANPVLVTDDLVMATIKAFQLMMSGVSVRVWGDTVKERCEVYHTMRSLINWKFYYYRLSEEDN